MAIGAFEALLWKTKVTVNVALLVAAAVAITICFRIIILGKSMRPLIHSEVKVFKRDAFVSLFCIDLPKSNKF